MSEEENKTGTEQPVETKVEETPKEEGKKFVEFTPEQEVRFKRIYGHMKEYERTIQKMSENQGVLISKIEELQTKSHVRDTTDTLTQLKAEKKAAYTEGNIDKVMDIDEKIIALSNKPEPEKISFPKSDPKKEAEEWLTPDRKVALDRWAQETDPQGTPIRPWTLPTHPKYPRLVEMAAGVMNDPDYKDGSLENVLVEVDRLMGVEKPRAVRGTAAVIGGDNNAGNIIQGDTKASEDQKRAARMMFPKLKPVEAENKYMNAVKKYGLKA